MSEGLIGPLKCDQTDKTYQKKKIELRIFIVYKGLFKKEVLYEVGGLKKFLGFLLGKEGASFILLNIILKLRFFPVAFYCAVRKNQ